MRREPRNLLKEWRDLPFEVRRERCKHLWENREALDKYLDRLKELMEEDVSSNNKVGDGTPPNNDVYGFSNREV